MSSVSDNFLLIYSNEFSDSFTSVRLHEIPNCFPLKWDDVTSLHICSAPMTLDYLSNIVRPVDLSRSRADLRSSSTTNFAMPQLQTKCGERTFSHAGPATWNALPEDMRAVSDSVLFRKRLKTHLFSLAFNVCWLLLPTVNDYCNAPMFSM